MRRFWFAATLAVLGGCASPEGTDDGGNPPKPHVEVGEHPNEASLGDVVLDPEAVDRLALQTSTVELASGERRRVVGGIVAFPPGGQLPLAAPVGGTIEAGKVPLQAGTRVEAGDVLLRLIPLAPVDRDLVAQARRQRASTKARVEMLRSRVDRLHKLMDARGASARTLEEAQADLATAEADDHAAQARVTSLARTPLDADVELDVVAPTAGELRSIFVQPGQVVTGGAPLLELGSEALWLRVPVYAGDMESVNVAAAVRVARVGRSFGESKATPVLGPRSANLAGTTVDRYYRLDEASQPDGRAWAPGERVLVELPLQGTADRTEVPGGAIVTDAQGDTWVYECLPERRFRRRRVEVIERDDARVLLARGPDAGTCVVSTGALELFGAELGVAH